MSCCVILGYGPGLGAAYARRFADAGYDLALLSRSGTEPLDELSTEARAYRCDAADPASVRAALDRVEQTQGSVDVLVYNADIGLFGTIEDVSEEAFAQSWQVGVLGLYTVGRHLAPRMAARGSGTIVVSGATAALRGRQMTPGIASTKSSQRILSQSLARTFGPQGVHVCYLIIDGVIDTEDTRTRHSPNKPDEFFLVPDRIADTAIFLTGQDRSAWTFEIDLRPFGEVW